MTCAISPGLAQISSSVVAFAAILRRRSSCLVAATTMSSVSCAGAGDAKYSGQREHAERCVPPDPVAREQLPSERVPAAGVTCFAVEWADSSDSATGK